LIQLVWDDATNDQDLHLVDTAIDDRICNNSGDCYWQAKTPVWFSSFAAAEGPNPVMEIDDVDGLGPETITVADPAPGRYRIFVHYFSGAAPTTETVRIYWDGAQIAQLERQLQTQKDLWAVADLIVAGGTLTVDPYPADEPGSIGAVVVMDTCNSPGFSFPSPCTSDWDCATGRCKVSTGSCVACLSDTDCTSPDTCNTTSNTCGSTATSCTTSADCGGLGCMMNLCVPCMADFMCGDMLGLTEICDTATGLCIAPDCINATDCAAGQGCASGRCGACAVDAECRAGQICDPSGTCIP